MAGQRDDNLNDNIYYRIHLIFLISTPAPRSLTRCLSAAAALGLDKHPVSAAAEVREMGDDSQCRGTCSHPDTSPLWLANLIVVRSLPHLLFTECERMLMGLKKKKSTQLDSALGSLKVWFILPHDNLPLFRKCTLCRMCNFIHR